jgi:heptosyltransferase-3
MKQQALPSALRQHLRLLVLRCAGMLAQRSTRPVSQPHRVLVIKPDHLGDVLLLTPALQLLREHLPMAQITLLVGPWSQTVVADNPYVDTVLTCAFPGFTRAKKTSLLQPYLLLFKMALLLRGMHFDTALIARDDHWWGALLAALAGIPQRIGHATPETSPLLTTALPRSDTDHVTEQNIALVEAFTGRQATQRPLLYSPAGPADHAWVEAWLAEHDLEATEIIAIHPGTGGAAKLWLARRWADLGNILQRRGMRIVLTGGPGEHDLLDSISSHMHQRPLIVKNVTIGQLAALYACCSLVLGVDSGPLHVAVAAGAPTISLFGPSDPQRYGPWGDPQRQIVLRSGLWCSPCGVLDACPRGTAPSECMALIPTAQVLHTVEKVLANNNPVSTQS